MMINYASPVPPENYKCATCGAHGCKLWRESAHFGPVVLMCVTCAGKTEGVDVSAVDETGRIPWKLGSSRTDTAPMRVPGVDRVVRVLRGMVSTCALREDGSLWCWGRSKSGVRVGVKRPMQTTSAPRT